MTKFSAVNINNIDQAAITVTQEGSIEGVNSQFCTLLRWEPQDIVHQNISILVSSKLIKKSLHDVYVQRYRPLRESRIIGKPRVLPVKNANDEDTFLSVQIIPIGGVKKFFYLGLFAKAAEKTVVIDKHDLFHIMKESLARCDRTETFRKNSQVITEVVGIVKSYLAEEIVIITRFLNDNFWMDEAWEIGKKILWKRKIGRLQTLYNQLLKYFETPALVYANIVGLRIVIPLLTSEQPELMRKVVQFTSEFFEVVQNVTGSSSQS